MKHFIHGMTTSAQDLINVVAKHFIAQQIGNVTGFTVYIKITFNDNSSRFYYLVCKIKDPFSYALWVFVLL
jgi:hypothetical protein